MLTASFQMSNLVVGISVSFFIALLYEKLFFHSKFESINLFWLFIYILVLFKNIVISNLQIAKRTLSKDMKLSPAIIALKSELKSEWKRLLLANSITLTPGTLTLDVKGGILYIHVIEYHNSLKEEKTIKELEDIIAKI